MNDNMLILITILLSSFHMFLSQSYSYTESSITLYDQSLYALSTKITILSNKTRNYDSYAWSYNLKNNVTTGVINPIHELTSLEGITANVFSFENSTMFPSLMAFGQVTNGELLSEGELGSTFFAHKGNQWVPDQILSANGPSKRTGSSLLVYKDQLIIFGGIIVSPNFNNQMLSRQLFSFDCNTQKWSELTSTAAEANIPPMMSHSATLVKDRYMVIIGGTVDLIERDAFPDSVPDEMNYSSNNLGKVFVFDLETDKWSTHETVNAPSYTFADHSASYIPQHNAIVVMGGEDEKIHEKNNVLLLLDIESWSWKKVTLTGKNLPDIPRLWQSSYLVQDQLFIMFGNVSRESAMDYLVVDVESWSRTNKIHAAPITSLKPSEFVENNNASSLSHRNSKLILGLTLGAIGGATVALILVLLARKIKQRRQERGTHQAFFLSPIWSDPTSHQATSVMALDKSVWEMDSHYAHSPRLSLDSHLQNRHPSHYHPLFSSDGTVRPHRYSYGLHPYASDQPSKIIFTHKDEPCHPPAFPNWNDGERTSYNLANSSTRSTAPTFDTTLFH